jgi:hypothetical protein
VRRCQLGRESLNPRGGQEAPDQFRLGDPSFIFDDSIRALEAKYHTSCPAC